MKPTNERKKMSETTDKTKYTKAWHAHVDELWPLCISPDNNSSDEVREVMARLNKLIDKIADAKFDAQDERKHEAEIGRMNAPA